MKKEMPNQKNGRWWHWLEILILLLLVVLLLTLLYRTWAYFAQYSILSSKSLLIVSVCSFALAISAAFVNFQQKIDVVAKKLADPPGLWALLTGIAMVILPLITTSQTFFYDGTGIGPVLYQWLFFLTVPLSLLGVRFLNDYFQKYSTCQERFYVSKRAAKHGFQYITFMSFTILPILLGSARENASKIRENAKVIIDTALRDHEGYIADSSREVLKNYVGDLSQGTPSSDVASALAESEVFDRAQRMLAQADELISDNPNVVFEGSLFVFFWLLSVWLLLTGFGFLAEQARSDYDQSSKVTGENSGATPGDLNAPVAIHKYPNTVQNNHGRHCGKIFGYVICVNIAFFLFRKLK
ncbi:hypothetical protein ACUH9X_06225 [Dermabacteraceae bacterium P13147]